MRLSQLYTSSFAKNTKHRIFENSKFYQAHDFPTKGLRGYDFRFLNTVDPPSINEILIEQRRWVQTKIASKINADVTNEVNKILHEVGNFNPFSFLDEYNTMFLDADNGGIASLYNTKTHKWDSQELLQHLQKHSNLINQLQNIFNELNKYIDAYNSFQLSILNQLSLMIQELKIDIAMAQQAQIPFQLDPNRSYLANSISSFALLKGRYLEACGVDFAQQTVPNIDYIAADFSQVYAPTIDIFNNNTIVGSSKQARFDIGVLNKEIGKSITVKWEHTDKDGTRKQKNTSLLELFEFLNSQDGKSQTVFIPNDDIDNYNKIIENLVGIQAKSNRQNIDFLSRSKHGRTIALRDVIKEDGTRQERALFQLSLLVSDPYRAHLKDTHDNYDALFNFCLGKYLTQIIGRENEIMLTKKGFQTVEDWLLDEFTEGKIMYAKTRVHIKHLERSIDIRFGIKK